MSKILQVMRERVCEANRSLPTHHLVKFTWGNVSEVNREAGVIVIKPSGVDYDLLTLWKLRKERLQYGFHPFIWEVGGKYIYPLDKDKIEYHHPRGFDDCFLEDSNIQFKALL